MIKQIAITEDYIVVRFENNSIDVYNRYGKAKEALREIAKEHLFEYNPDWNTHQFGKKLIDAIGSEAKAIVNDNYVVYIDTKGSIICGRKSQENTKEKLRMIVNKYSTPYEESWNTQQLGRKVIKHLLSAKADSTVQDKKYFPQKIRKDIIEFLEKTSKLFYNERDLQMNLADFLKRQNYYDNVFLEYSLPAFSSSEEEELTLDLEADIRIDIVVEKNRQFCPIELKYKTKKVEKEGDVLERFGKEIDAKLLKNQAALNIGRYSFWKDVKRLEMIKEYFKPNVIAGFCVFMTNDQGYMNPTKGSSAAFTMKAGEKTPQTGELKWEESTAKSTKEKYPTILLKVQYTIEKWYKTTNQEIDFHYCIVEV